MKEGLLSRIATYGLAVAVGVVLGRIFRDVPYFTVGHEIDLVATLGLVLTVLISIAFYRHFEKRKHSDQLRKQAALERLSASMRNVTALDEHCGASRPEYLGVVKLLKKCRSDFNQYVRFAEAVQFPVERSTESAYRIAWAELRELLTNTPAATAAEAPLKVVNGCLVLSENRRVEIEIQMNEVKSALFSIETAIIIKV
jgi:hypothetical protein